MSNHSTLWRRPYTLRRYSPQTVVDGYAVKSHEDKTVMLDVQFLSQKELQLLPEGKRSEARIKSYGSDVIRTADVKTGTPADRLFYQGDWWECEASVVRDKTVISHCRAQYVRVSEADNEPAPVIETPKEDEEG